MTAIGTVLRAMFGLGIALFAVALENGNAVGAIGPALMIVGGAGGWIER